MKKKRQGKQTRSVETDRNIARKENKLNNKIGKQNTQTSSVETGSNIARKETN